MFRRFGSEVTIIEMGAAADRARGRRRLRRDPGDPGARGHRRPPEREVHQLRQARRGDRSRASTAQDGAPEVQRHRTCCSRWAGGPNTDDLGLEKAGVAVDERGYIVVDDRAAHQRARASGRSATATARARSRTPSYNDFEIVAANLLDNDPRRVSDRITAYALYIDPPLGRAGMTEARDSQERAQGADRQAADDARRTRRRKGRDAGLHEDRRSTRRPAPSWAPRSWARAATRSSTRFST